MFYSGWNAAKDICPGSLVVCECLMGHLPSAVLIMAENGWNWPMLADFFLLFSAHFGQIQPFSAIITTAQGKCPQPYSNALAAGLEQVYVFDPQFSKYAGFHYHTYRGETSVSIHFPSFLF